MESNPVFVGTGEPNATILVTEPGGATCSTTVTVSGTWTCTIAPALTSGNTYDFDITQTDTVGLASSAAMVSVTVDTMAPIVTIEQATTQPDPTPLDNARFTVTFNEPIDEATFTAADITIAGIVGTVNVGPTAVAPNDGTTFEFVVSGIAINETVTVSLDAGQVTDLAGNLNEASTSVDNQVTRDLSVDTDGDGVSDAIEAIIGTDPTIDDSDGDGTDDSNNDLDNVHPQIELGAQNAGDGNGDGVLDAIQNEVTSIPNVLNTQYNSLQIVNTAACSQIAEFDSLREVTLATQDQSQNYPLGLWDFAINCAVPGTTVDIIIYLDRVYDTSEWTYKKYDRNSNTYTDISSIITYMTVNRAGTNVTTINYSVTDGGVNDEDGIANGIIVDPAGPGLPAPVAPINPVVNGAIGPTLRYAGQAREDFRSTRTGWNKHEFAEQYAISQNEVADANDGRESKILTYTDEFGQEKFQGYVAGKIAVDRFKGTQNKGIHFTGLFRNEKSLAGDSNRDMFSDFQNEPSLASAPKHCLFNAEVQASVAALSTGKKRAELHTSVVEAMLNTQTVSSFDLAEDVTWEEVIRVLLKLKCEKVLTNAQLKSLGSNHVNNNELTALNEKASAIHYKLLTSKDAATEP